MRGSTWWSSPPDRRKLLRLRRPRPQENTCACGLGPQERFTPAAYYNICRLYYKDNLKILIAHEQWIYSRLPLSHDTGFFE